MGRGVRAPTQRYGCLISLRNAEARSDSGSTEVETAGEGGGEVGQGYAAPWWAPRKDP